MLFSLKAKIISEMWSHLKPKNLTKDWILWFIIYSFLLKVSVKKKKILNKIKNSLKQIIISVCLSSGALFYDVATNEL